MGSHVPKVFQVASENEVAAARAIISEYAASLGVDLSYQNFDEELAQLPGEYSRPRGRLLLASVGEDVAGCIALRARSDEVCEMKRLYVRPSFRGLRLGHLLATTAIAEARAIGYRSMRLDTLPFMTSAQRMYAALGFVPCAPYYTTAIAGTVFMELELGAPLRGG